MSLIDSPLTNRIINFQVQYLYVYASLSCRVIYVHTKKVRELKLCLTNCCNPEFNYTFSSALFCLDKQVQAVKQGIYVDTNKGQNFKLF